MSNPSIALIGLMGCGKSTLGPLLAARLAIPFVDSDAEIVREAGCSIAEIFAQQGEAAFRDLEHRVIQRLLAGEAKVIATGGGAFAHAPTRALLLEESISLWLHASLETLVARVGTGEGRPLLQQGDPRTILAKLMDQRYPLYAEAELMVDVSDLSPEAVVEEIIALLEDDCH
jgi:shikimate kinase